MLMKTQIFESLKDIFISKIEFFLTVRSTWWEPLCQASKYYLSSPNEYYQYTSVSQFVWDELTHDSTPFPRGQENST